MTSNFAECGGFLKTRPDLDVPDIQLHFVIALVDDHARKRGSRTAFPAMSACCGRRAAARCRLRSADPLPPPLIDPEFSRRRSRRREHGRRLQDHPPAAGCAGASPRSRERDMFTADVRSDDDIRAVLPAPRRHGLSSGRHLPHGRGSVRGGRAATARVTASRACAWSTPRSCRP